MVRSILFALLANLVWFGSLLANPPVSKSVATDADDAVVLEAMLVDLLTRPHSPVERDFSKSESKKASETQIKFSTEAVTLLKEEKAAIFPDARSGFYDDFEKQMTKLTTSERAQANEAVDDLLRRSRQKELFKPFVPKNKRITMYTGEAEKEQRDRAAKTEGFGGIPPQVFRACSPGYSRDRNVATVVISFGWSIHAGQGTYVLVKRNGTWSIVVSQLIFFL